MAPIREEKKNEKNEKQINVFLITSGKIRNSIHILFGQWIVDIVETLGRIPKLENRYHVHSYCSVRQG
ncbi:Uncharacterized protein APZ42_000404 [Daphnia magna]|nr:Uncharacterized protein APZ42_000404 [Daphnia magna]